MQARELEVRARQERYFDYRREAERHQLVRLAVAGQAAGDPFFRPVLAGLGRRLSEWGSSLQARYGMAERLEPRRAGAATR